MIKPPCWYGLSIPASAKSRQCELSVITDDKCHQWQISSENEKESKEGTGITFHSMVTPKLALLHQ